MSGASATPGPASGNASPRRAVVVIVGLGAILLVVSAARLLVGEPMPRTETGAIDWELFRQFVEQRQYRLIVAGIVGAALAIGGALLQALLRNPLASPYILGISSGAAVGVVLSWVTVSVEISSGWLAVADALGRGGAACGTALLTLLIVYVLGQRRGWIDPLGLLLVGVIINAFNGAVIMLISALYPQGLRSDLFQWMMGYLDDNASMTLVGTVGAITLIGWGIAIRLGPAMDVATFSDTEAHGLGLNLPRLRLGLFTIAGVLTAATVLLAGPIGFVGLIGPHLVRLLVGPRHRPLVIGSALSGAALVIAADTAIKAFDVYVHDVGLLPIGAVTALIGGPVFVIMLRPQLGEGRGA